MSRFAGHLAARLSAVLLAVLFLPVAAHAQAAMTGVVKDASGGVLPGVTVEAASPVLIEKVRSVTTDATGQYRIVDLRPGVYSVTFSLPGFSTVKRDGIELSGTFVATVNGELRVGALEETITVTGETPIVDVQSAKVQQTVSKDIISSIPTSRMASSIQALIPGLSASSNVGDVGGAGGTFSGTAGLIHGAHANNGRSLNDGLDTSFNGGTGGMFMANVGGAQEVVISTSGGLGEAEVGGVIFNVIPRDGSNTYSGSLFAAGANGSMQGSNFTQELKDEGVTAPNQIIKNYDINPMGGGRIVRDKLWFYVTSRFLDADNTISNIYFNKNAGNVNAWTYDPDLARQGFFPQHQDSLTGRLTWQATPRNKITLYWDEQRKCFGCQGGGVSNPPTAPEATGDLHNWPARVQQVTWSSPLTSKVLLEAGYGDFLMTYRTSVPHEDGSFSRDLFSATEQAGVLPGLLFRAPASYGYSKTGTRTWRAAVSYVTGAHNMKFGYFGGFSTPMGGNYWFNDITNYRFNNGVANQLTLTAAKEIYNTRNLVPTSFYGQDQWTQGKLTLQGGVRYDHMVTSFGTQQVGGDSPFIPVPYTYASRSISGVGFNDITPRMGAAYDLFGNGKTALKVTVGKYPLAQTVQGGELDLSPLGRLALSTTRSWSDSNTNYVADCDLTNPAKNGECGADANKAFGQNAFTTTFDPAVTEGWGNRQYNWEFGASVQHEIVPRVSVNVGYFRRVYGNFLVTDNRAVTASDYTPFTLTVNDPRLPGGTSTITAFDVDPSKFGLVDNYRTAASTFGKQIEHWDGVDVTFNARLKSLSTQGGFSTGRTLMDNCAVVAQVPEALFGAPNIADANANVWASSSYCRQQSPMLTQVRGFASYTIPKVELQVSGTLQNNPGPQQVANYSAPVALVAPALGRPLAGNASSVAVNLVEPGTLYGPRFNQVDFRVAKLLRFQRSRLQLGFDVYNAFNSAVPQTYNNTYVSGGVWLRPQDILVARFAKVSASFDF